MKSWRIAIPLMGVALTLCSAFILWTYRNPLKQYGISYEIDSGEHQELQFLWFYWNRGQHRITGPRITGEDLYVTYKRTEGEKVPEIVVRSQSSEGHYAVLRVNFTDSAKPE